MTYFLQACAVALMILAAVTFYASIQISSYVLAAINAILFLINLSVFFWQATIRYSQKDWTK